MKIIKLLSLFIIIFSACSSTSSRQGQEATYAGNVKRPNSGKLPGKFRVNNNIKDYLDFFDLDEEFFEQTCQGSEEPLVGELEDELLLINFLDYEGELKLISVEAEALQNGQVAEAQSVNPNGYSAFCDIQLAELDGNPLIGLACRIYSEDQLFESCGIIASQQSPAESDVSNQEEPREENESPEADGPLENQEGGDVPNPAPENPIEEGPIPSVENLNDNYSAFEVKAFELFRNNVSNCVTVENASFQIGTALISERCHQSNKQKFFYSKSSGQIKIQNLDGFCWNVDQGNFLPGAALDISDCNATPAQSFDYDLLTYQIRLRVDPGLCVTIQEGLNDDNVRVVLQNCDVDEISASQKFLMGRAVQIRSLLGGNRCLNVSEALFEDHSLIQNSECLAQDRRQSFIYEPWSGTIRSKSNDNFCLDLNLGVFEVGNSLQLYHCNATPAQRFYYLEESQQFFNVDNSNYCFSSSGNFLELDDCQDDLSQKYELIDLLTTEEASLFREGEIPPSNSFDISSHNQQARSALLSPLGNPLCIDVVDGEYVARTPLEVQECVDNRAQEFLYRYDEETILTNQFGLSYCWDVPDGNTNAPLQLFVCNGTDPQNFAYNKETGQIRYTVFPDSNWCVELQDQSNQPGTSLVLRDCSTPVIEAQIFHLAQDVQIELIMRGDSDQTLCLDVDNEIFEENRPVNLIHCKDTLRPAQRFAYERWSGLIRIAVSNIENIDLCLTDSSQNLEEGSRMQLNTCNNNLPSQKFFYNSRTKSLVSIENPTLCLGATPHGNHEGSPLYLRSCTGDAAQQFDLVDSRR